MGGDAYAVWEGGRLRVGSAAAVNSHGRYIGRYQALMYSTCERPLLWLGATGDRRIAQNFESRRRHSRGGKRPAPGVANSINRTFPGSLGCGRLIASTVERGFLLSAAFPSVV